MKKITINKKPILGISCFLLLIPYLIVSGVVGNAFILLFSLILFGIGLINKYLYASLGVALLLINSVHFHVEDKWGLEDFNSRLEASIEAPSYEMFEYLKVYTDYFDLGILFYFLSNIAILFVFVREIKSVKFNSKAVLSGTFITVFASSYILLNHIDELKRFPLLDMPFELYGTAARYAEVSKRQEYLRENPVQVTCSDDYNKVVIVLGESALSDRMSIYGYNKKTTPFLESINPYKINSISPTNQTRYSIPIMLTEATVTEYDKFYQSASLISKFNSCNFETFWISNQGKHGDHETSIASIASEANYTHFLNDLSYLDAGYDGEIFDVLNKEAITGSTKQAFFIHLMGSHQDYSKRYPIEHALSSNDDVISQYNNSLLYTDFVLSKIHALFEGHENTLFIYVADHGEVVDKKKHGHGFLPSYKEEYRIPFLLWANESHKIDALVKHTANRRVNTESFNLVIEYIVGMQKDMNVSFRDHIFSLSPRNQLKYTELSSYSK